MNERTAAIYLINAADKYYGYENLWLCGKGRHTVQFALLPHEEQWQKAMNTYDPSLIGYPPFGTS